MRDHDVRGEKRRKACVTRENNKRVTYYWDRMASRNARTVVVTATYCTLRRHGARGGGNSADGLGQLVLFSGKYVACTVLYW